MKTALICGCQSNPSSVCRFSILLGSVYDKLDIDYWVLNLSSKYLSKWEKQSSDYRMESNLLRCNNLTI